MEVVELIPYGITYVLGFIASLIFLAKFGKKIGCGDYDPPHEGWYDDYDSNASAWFAFSLAWPIFYTFGIVGFLYTQFIKFYKKTLS